MNLSRLLAPAALCLLTSLHGQVLFTGSYSQNFDSLLLSPDRGRILRAGT